MSKALNGRSEGVKKDGPGSLLLILVTIQIQYLRSYSFFVDRQLLDFRTVDFRRPTTLGPFDHPVSVVWTVYFDSIPFN